MRYEKLLNPVHHKQGFECVFGFYHFVYQNFTLNIASMYNSKFF